MIPLFKPRIEKSVTEAVRKVLYSGFIGQGEKVEEFEKALVPWVGRKTILSVNNCTSAIQLALRLSGVKPGDEVISTPVTCAATNEPVLAMGAKLVWADVDPWTGCLDFYSLKKALTKKTKAVIAVHWGGQPCDLFPIAEFCREHGLKLIEDAAHALGAEYMEKPIGSHGDFVCFSFQAIKHVTCVDGGLLSCKSAKDYERGKLLRWYGIKRPTDLTKDIPEWGYKFHMNDVAATIGIENLKGLSEDLRIRRKNADYFSVNIDGHAYNYRSAFWFFAIHRENPKRFIHHMAKRGIAVGPVHERNDRYSMFKASNGVELPGVDSFCSTQVNIPCGPWVGPAERKHIVQTVNDYKT